MKKVVEKGYTVEVTSWENDGDNYCTKQVTYDTEEKAKCVLKMCKELFSSDSGIGNMCEGEEAAASNLVHEYLKANEEVVAFFGESNGDLDDMVSEINWEVMGSSECYISRVFETGTIYYAPEDICLEEIEV